MKYSQAFIPTVREVPSDATIASHILMIRAGLIRQLAAGIYSYLPLGYRALRKAEQIVREEMNKADAIELHMPVLIPTDLFKKTNRLDAFGPILMRFKDQHDAELALGPTHEEVITKIVAEHITSYKQLPINLYQIQTKFRDEERPKSGVLRTREFLMKDAYSFHTSIEDLDNTYQRMYDAYVRIFKRCGLPTLAVEAESGPIGGSLSHEFMTLTDVGEDQVVICENCKYAANVEKAERKINDVDIKEISTQSAAKKEPTLDKVHTPNMSTIADVSEFLKCKPQQMIKTLVYRAGDDVIVGLIRGDHEANEAKLAKAAGVEALKLADDVTIRELTGAEVGFAGPVKLDTQKACKIVVDYDVLTITDGVTGANETDYHLTGVVPGRDFSLVDKIIADIRNVVENDPCPRCGKPLKFQRAIEVGHVFKLGTKYSSALGAKFLDAEGQSHDMIMGCYGIGINRILASVIETSHDDAGIIWPISIAPYQVIILALNVSNEQVTKSANELYEKLTACGLEVLYDDRDLRPGVKFKDADLLGIPIRVTIGPKGLAEGNVEIKLRRDKEARTIAFVDAYSKIIELKNMLFEELK